MSTRTDTLLPYTTLFRSRERPGEAFRLTRSVAPPARAAGSRLEQIRVGWDRQRRSTDPVTLRYPFEVDRIHVVRRRRAAVPPDNDPIKRCATRPVTSDHPALSSPGTS